jgi:hypothetical protein
MEGGLAFGLAAGAIAAGAIAATSPYYYRPGGGGTAHDEPAGWIVVLITALIYVAFG